MGLIREPKNADLSMKSEPWTEKELTDFRKLMQKIKMKSVNKNERVARLTTKKLIG